MGETAREQIFDVLNAVLNDSSLTLKVFAYDLNEPDVVKILLTLAAQGRVRVILDNARTPPGRQTQDVGRPVRRPVPAAKKSPSDIITGVVRALLP